MALHDGHRKRMYEKAEKGILAEHEWLEVVLFGAIPRKNTNEIAHRLIARFGSAERVFFASMSELQEVEGVGASVAAQIRAIGHFFAQHRVAGELKFDGVFSTEAFLPFVKKAYADIYHEVVDIYLLDGECHVVKKQRFTVESICSVQVIPEDMATFILTEDVSGIVMVHNHPFGDALPSGTDDLMTKNCQMLCSMHNRLFCDHIIYAPSGIYSYYASGRMKEITKNYSVSSILG